MRYFDVAVIGGGVLGCFAARNLTKWKLSAVLLEAEEDVCMGITKANSSICYAGYDHVTGSLKEKLTLAANASMQSLCEALEVPFLRRGGLMVASGVHGLQVLKSKAENKSQVPGLRIISGEEAREMEPMLSEAVTAALYSPTTAVVNPWQLGIAAFENAVYNGCIPMTHTSVCNIQRAAGGYVIETAHEEICCKAVINCAGLFADKVQELLFPPRIRLTLDASDYLVFDRHCAKPEHVIFEETEEQGKGITVIPTTEGNLLIESMPRMLKGEWFSSSGEQLKLLQASSKALLPSLDMTAVIRNFAAVRPNPRRVVYKEGQWVWDEHHIRSFAIDEPEPGFISLIGIKTPGLTCADQLGQYVAEKTAVFLQAEENKAFVPKREAIRRMSELSMQQRAEVIRCCPEYAEVICQCEDVTKGEILEAIKRGAVSVDGIKHRLGTCMGTCQGGRCARRLEQILGEIRHEKC